MPAIVQEGGASYARLGTDKSKGTKVFALAGNIRNTGGRAFKAAQTGGPSGGCIPAAHLDLPVGYETLAEVGSIMGSGGLIVMDDTACMVDVARYFMEFCRDESCGKCVPCRAGTVQMHGLLTKITAGHATEPVIVMHAGPV